MCTALREQRAKSTHTHTAHCFRFALPCGIKPHRYYIIRRGSTARRRELQLRRRGALRFYYISLRGTYDGFSKVQSAMGSSVVDSYFRFFPCLFFTLYSLCHSFPHVSRNCDRKYNFLRIICSSLFRIFCLFSSLHRFAHNIRQNSPRCPPNKL